MASTIGFAMETRRVFERQEINFYAVTEWNSYFSLSNFTINTESGTLLLTAEIIAVLSSLRNALRCKDERALCGRNLQSHKNYPISL